MEKKKVGRPPMGALAQTNAERQRSRRERLHAAAAMADTETFTVAQCLATLSNPSWRHGAVGRGAWLRLGELLEFRN